MTKFQKGKNANECTTEHSEEKMSEAVVGVLILHSV